MYAEDAGNLLRYNISTYSMALTDVSEGGMAFLIRDEAGEEFSSQLAWGYGCEEGFGREPSWYLFFDEGPDDAGQMAFAKWLMGHTREFELCARHGGRNRPGRGEHARLRGRESTAISSMATRWTCGR